MCGCVWFQLAGAEPHTVYLLFYLFSSSVCVSVSLCICAVISGFPPHTPWINDRSEVWTYMPHSLSVTFFSECISV